ncbi:MAG: 4-alpha-glucanotransferase [Chlamydiales bacterium]|nr:4-alpha-glucanotransferase [Chlamydiales bacterium]
MNGKLEKTLHNSAAHKHWEKIGIFPHHGFDIPLSAIHSKNSCGIGEFLDLIPLIDWCHEIKMDVIQLLPLNDSGNDPSPYNALSSCALNPIYLSLHALPFIDELPELHKSFTQMRALTQSPKVHYHEVKVQKLYWLRLYFAKAGKKLIKKPEFEQFIAENGWTISYGLFKTLKDILEQSLWQYWPDELKHPTKKQYDDLVECYWDEICFHICLQYLAFDQFKAVKKYAENARVLLKGDVPILISRDSADVWYHPNFFNLDYSAGAPPDPYSEEQQYWGFPLYRWEEKKKTQYSWWKQRLKVASNFFDLYRVDHVIGLFRIWAIPVGHPITQGHYIPTDESLWLPQGRELLTMMLSSFEMLPIAEDLGNVSPDIRLCLKELGIPGTKVIRWERRWETDKSFIPLDEYTPISMTTLSTHDSETLALWWRDIPLESKAFAKFKGWTYAPELTRAQRKEILWESHHTASLFHINLLQEYLALYPELVWPDPQDERINIPGKILPSNWTYRFRPSVEDLLAHENLQREIQEIVMSPATPAIRLLA